jgi:hypothetical protein
MTYITIVKNFFSYGTLLLTEKNTTHFLTFTNNITQQKVSGEKGYTSPETNIKSEIGTQIIRHRFDPDPFALLALRPNSVDLAE